jgi:hypothetical protein
MFNLITQNLVSALERTFIYLGKPLIYSDHILVTGTKFYLGTLITHNMNHSNVPNNKCVLFKGTSFKRNSFKLFCEADNCILSQTE